MIEIEIVGVQEGAKGAITPVKAKVSALPVVGGELTFGKGINRKTRKVIAVDRSSTPPRVTIQL